MRLTPDGLVQKWTDRFTPNDQFRITAGDLQAFTVDLADTFGGVLANVPTWVDGTDYPAGYLIRYSQAGGRESFYYSLVAGLLPHPTYNQADATWKVVPGPVAETTLYQYLPLNVASGMDGDSVVPGRRYGVVGKWNASADDQLVYLDGLENTFRRRGTLVLSDGSQQEVDVNVVAGTYAPVAAGGSGGSALVQLTNPGGSPYVDVLLQNPAAQLLTCEPLANYANVLAQVIHPFTNAAFATESAVLADVQASVAAAWATSPPHLVLRTSVVPLRNGLVAHGQLRFSQPPTAWPQSLAPHPSGFRLYGNAFALGNVEWTHPSGMSVTGSDLFNANPSANATGSPLAQYSGGLTGLVADFEFTHNRHFQYDVVGLTDAVNPSLSNFLVAFYIVQASDWQVLVGGQLLAQGSLGGSNWRFRIKVYDDHVEWLLDGTTLYTLVGSLTANQLWPAASLGRDSGLTNCRFGGQVTSPR